MQGYEREGKGSRRVANECSFAHRKKLLLVQEPSTVQIAPLERLSISTKPIGELIDQVLVITVIHDEYPALTSLVHYLDEHLLIDRCVGSAGGAIGRVGGGFGCSVSSRLGSGVSSVGSQLIDNDFIGIFHDIADGVEQVIGMVL